MIERSAGADSRYTESGVEGVVAPPAPDRTLADRSSNGMAESQSTPFPGASTRPAFQWRWIETDIALASFQYPKEPGCYAIYFDGRLVYIGQTRNLKARFANYRIRHGYGCGYITPWGQFRVESVTVKFKPSRRYGDWAMRELRLIRRLKPELNCVGSRARRSPNGQSRYGWQERQYQALFEGKHA